MRVAVISTYPPQRCGIGYYTRDMLETLLAKNLELEFYVFAEKRAWIPYRAKDQGGIHEYRVWDRHSYLYPLMLFRSIQKIKPDLVLVQHEYGLYGYFGGYLLSFLLALLRLFRYPIFMTMHTVCPRRRLIKSLKESLRYSRMMIVLRWIDVILTNFSVVKLVEKVIVHSEGLASQMIKDYGFSKEKVVMIPHGASNFIGMSGEKAKELLDLKDKFVILSFGFLSYRKGYEYAIKAVSELVGRYDNLVYLIAGTNQSRSGIRYLRELMLIVKRLKLEDNVRFYTKQIPVEEIPMIFGAADIVVLPYLALFGDSGVLRQAAAFAKPVIASAVGAMTEEIKNNVNGLVVPPGNVKLLKEGVEYLLNHPEKGKEMGITLQNKASKEWAWERVVENIYTILTENLDQKAYSKT